MNSAPVCSFAVTPFPQHMLPDPSVLEGRLTSFFASQRYPCRMISISTRCTLNEPISAIRQRLEPLEHLSAAVELLHHCAPEERSAATLAALPEATRTLALSVLGDDTLRMRLTQAEQDAAAWEEALVRWGQISWRTRWLKEYRRLLTFLSERYLRRIRHAMLIWPSHHVDTAALALAAAGALGTLVTPAPLVAPLNGRYHEHLDHLAPERPGQPFAALLTSYDLRGSWDLRTLHGLLHLDSDIALAIDNVPIGPTSAAIQTDAAFHTQRAQVLDTGVKDVRAERALRDVELAMHSLDQQCLHRVSITLLVQAADRATLERRVQEASGALGTRLRLHRPAGGQAALLQLFSPTPTAQIDAPLRPRTTLSHGLAVSVPFGFCRPDSTAGILWGIEQGSAAPVFFDPFAERQAAHLVCVGKTGSGKTFALHVWLLRLLLQGHQTIVFEPMGHAQRLVAACGRGGASYRVALGQPVNVLDIAVPPQPSRLAAQIAHVRSQLSLLLGTSEIDSHGEQKFRARVFSNFERAMLEQALMSLYGSSDPDTLPIRATPLLSDLCATLVRQRSQVASLLAEELDGVLVSSSQGVTFNAPTEIDWRFEADCCAYDFSDVPNELRPFYYGQALGALNRYVHDPRRRRDRHLIAAFDEFRYLSQANMLEGYAALAARTWRTRGAAIWTLDQTAHTYLGLPGHENPSGRSLIDNCPIRIIFRQDDMATHQIGDAIRLLTPAYLDAIRLADVGECVAVVHNQVYRLSVQASDAEERFFGGT